MSTQERNGVIVRKYLVAVTSILLVTAIIGSLPAFADESKKETEKAADTKAADSSEWDAYTDELQEQIVGKWFPPSGIRHYKGVKFELRIRKDGKLSRVNLTKSSQIIKVDEAARKAVNRAAPYKPFPDGIKKEFANFEVNLDKSEIDLKRKIVRKIDQFSKPSRGDQSKDAKMSF